MTQGVRSAWAEVRPHSPKRCAGRAFDRRIASTKICYATGDSNWSTGEFRLIFRPRRPLHILCGSLCFSLTAYTLCVVFELATDTVEQIASLEKARHMLGVVTLFFIARFSRAYSGQERSKTRRGGRRDRVAWAWKRHGMPARAKVAGGAAPSAEEGSGEGWRGSHPGPRSDASRREAGPPDVGDSAAGGFNAAVWSGVAGDGGDSGRVAVGGEPA